MYNYAYKYTTGSLTGDRAKTIGRANDDITKPVVMNIASSKHGLELFSKSFA